MIETAVEQEVHDRTVFGFWVYLMSDCILFGMLFATYAVLHSNTHGGPSGRELFDMHFVLVETVLLLTSSFTCGVAMLPGSQKNKKKMLGWFALTAILGMSFVCMELIEFTGLVRGGNSWERSGFLTSFFTLVGTHGLHVSIGLLWMIVLMVQVFRQGVTATIFKRLSCLRFFWHFLDVVWIFIFTLVYLMGAKIDG